MKSVKFLFTFLVLFISIIGTAQITDTITYLYQPFSGDSALLKIKKGKYIVVYKDPAPLYDEMGMERAVAAAGPMCPSVDVSQKCQTDVFQGCIRAKVKTTMLKKKPTYYATVAELLAVLPGKEDMKTRGISSAENSERDIAENENVVVETAYLFAIYKEDDNDYHMIIGSTAKLNSAVLMNIEISGLPRSASTATKNKFRRVRGKIENTSYLQNIPCKPSPILLLGTAIILKNIKGSLFWDSQHSGGGVGPSAARPNSAWEIHPVIKLKVAGPVGM